MTQTDDLSPLSIASTRTTPQLKLNGFRSIVVAGALFMLSFPPFGWWPLLFISIALLFHSIQSADRFRSAYGRGFLFGCIGWGGIWLWSGSIVNNWVGRPYGVLAGATAWLSLTLLMANIPAIWAAITWRLTRGCTNKLTLCLLASATWSVMEWCRTWGSLSLPWAQISTALSKIPILLQIASVTGALGVSFALFFIGAAMSSWRNPLPLLLLLPLWLFGWVQSKITEKGELVTVAIMQSNFSMKETNEPGFSDQHTYSKLTSQLYQTGARPDLVVWSESASMRDAWSNSVVRNDMNQLASNYKQNLLIGSRVVISSGKSPKAEFNSVLLFMPAGGMPQRYDKQRLVAFGEFVPMRALIPGAIYNAFDLFPNDVSEGKAAKPLTFQANDGKFLKLGVFICFESLYPDLVRRQVLQGVDILANPTNDKWLPKSGGRQQSFQADVLRAIENGRPVVRCSNGGNSAIIDADGTSLAPLPVDREASQVQTLYLRKGLTLYTRFGDWFAMCCLATTFGYVLFRMFRRSAE